MISVPIHNQSGKEVGVCEFPQSELASSVNKQLLHDVVVMYEANRRVGTVRTRSRGMVRGSTRKLFRQKGTGRARAGASRTPVRRGGGHAFGKVPLDWSYRLPKKAIRLATRMALLSKFLDDQVTVLDQFSLAEPKTKVVAGIFDSLGLADVGCLLVIEQHDPLVTRSVRNLPQVWVSPASGLNAYSLLHQRQLVVTVAALESLRVGAVAEDAGVESESASV